MNKPQFEQLKESLIKRGYKLYDQQWHLEDYIIGKSFHKEDNQWDDERPAYRILISVYDWTDPSKSFYDRLPSNMKKRIGLEVHIDMSRTINERVELAIPFHDNDTIDEIERIAEGFYTNMCLLLPEPRQEKPLK